MHRSVHPLCLLMDLSDLPSTTSPVDSRLMVVKTATRLHNHNTPCSLKARMVQCLPTALMALSARPTALLPCSGRLFKQMERMVLLSLYLSAAAWAQEAPWVLPLGL